MVLAPNLDDIFPCDTHTLIPERLDGPLAEWSLYGVAEIAEARYAVLGC